MNRTLAGRLRNIYSSGNELTVLTLLDKLIKEVEDYEATEGLPIYRHDIIIETDVHVVFLTLYTHDETNMTDNASMVATHLPLNTLVSCSGISQFDTDVYPIVACGIVNNGTALRFRYVTPTESAFETSAIAGVTDKVTKED